VLDDSELDLSMREADVAIRMSPPRQPDLIQRHLVTIHFHIYASPDYIKKNGLPQTPDELDQHKLIVYGEEARAPIANVNWLLTAGAPPDRPRRATLCVNNVYAIYRAAVSGLGIAALPDYMANETGTLQRILPELAGPPIDTYFVYPEELRSSKRISVFRDFLVRKVNETRLS
jgi:DNA-binding transcriptional LysR family regulator